MIQYHDFAQSIMKWPSVDRVTVLSSGRQVNPEGQSLLAVGTLIPAAAAAAAAMVTTPLMQTRYCKASIIMVTSAALTPKRMLEVAVLLVVKL